MSKRILLVEDDSEILGLQKEILTRAGFAVDSATGGSHALEQLKTVKYDAIVLDVEMPGMDGYEVARQIRQLKGSESNRGTPIIFVTGTTDREAMQRGFSVGAVAFVSKPFRPAAFRSAIQGLIG